MADSPISGIKGTTSAASAAFADAAARRADGEPVPTFRALSSGAKKALPPMVNSPLLAGLHKAKTTKDTSRSTGNEEVTENADTPSETTDGVTTKGSAKAAPLTAKEVDAANRKRHNDLVKQVLDADLKTIDDMSDATKHVKYIHD